jgi:hypothetical protein
MSDVEFIPFIQIGCLKTKIVGVNNKKLYKEIIENSKPIDKYYTANRYHTYYEDQKFPYGSPECDKLIDILTKEVSRILGREMVMNEIWTLTLKNNESVAYHSHKSNMHLHPKEYYSIAYYVNAPSGSAEIQFQVTACNTIESSISIPPSEGDLLLFNSFIPHMTNRHNNVYEDRVVVSANFAPAAPRDVSTQDWTVYRNSDKIGS